MVLGLKEVLEDMEEIKEELKRRGVWKKMVNKNERYDTKKVKRD